MSAPKQIRVLKRLAVDGGCILRADGRWVVASGQDKRRKTTLRLSCEEVRGMVSDGVIAAVGDVYQLTEEGLSHARRAAAPIDAFRRQHQQLVRKSISTEGGAFVDVDTDVGRSPVRKMNAASCTNGRKAFSHRAMLASEKYCTDCERAQAGPRVTSDWSSAGSRAKRGASSAFGGLTQGQRNAHERVQAAEDALGSGLSEVAKAFCVDGRSLTAIEQAFGWPRSSARVVLGLALERLADHYGLARSD